MGTPDRTKAPDSVEIAYRIVGDTHVFTANKGIKGMVHVGSVNREHAFESAISALTAHVAIAYGVSAKYATQISYEEFCQHADDPLDICGNLLIFLREQEAA